MKAIILFLFFVILVSFPTSAWATNESSYINGYWQGSSAGPNNAPGQNADNEFTNYMCRLHQSDTSFWPKNLVVPATTNTTACENGFFAGWKDWCTKNAVDCVENMTIGFIPPMILKTHEEYFAGAKAGNNSGSSCPYTGNMAFCQGWLSTNSYNDEGCSDDYANYTGPFSSGLIGCPLDAIKQDQMAKPHLLVGTWNYLNESSSKMPLFTLSGKISYSPLGNFTLTIPTKSGFGDLSIEGSWGHQLDPKHNILTLCYTEGCENNTLQLVTPNYVEFIDLHKDLISLTRVNEYPQNLIRAGLIDDLLSRSNQNGTVLPAVDFPERYVDLSNPSGARPSITVLNDTFYHQKWGESREMNKSSTTWNIYNATSGSNGTITFTDCNTTNDLSDFIQCPNDPPTYYRQLHSYLYKGTWSLLYPIEKTSSARTVYLV